MDYIPKSDSEFNDWVKIYAAYININHLALGLTLAQNTALQAFFTTWETDYDAHVAEQATASSFVEKKDDSRKFLEENDKILFYVESPRKEISAYGEVVEISIGSPKVQWSKFGDISVFEKDDFWRFARTKRKILAIKMTNFKEIKPLNEQVLKDIIPPKLLSGSYIDMNTIKKLIGN